VDERGLNKEDIVMVTGIGWSARMAGYMDFHTMHTLHGRAPAFAAMELAKASGATFAARTTTFHVRELQKFLTMATGHDGFSVVEVFSQCPNCYGRRNGIGETTAMPAAFHDGTASIGSKALEEYGNLIPRGIFVNREAPEYGSSYAGFCAKSSEAQIPERKFGKDSPRC
jgi:hypothetical protein